MSFSNPSEKRGAATVISELSAVHHPKEDNVFGHEEDNIKGSTPLNFFHPKVPQPKKDLDTEIRHPIPDPLLNGQPQFRSEPPRKVGSAHKPVLRRSSQLMIVESADDLLARRLTTGYSLISSGTCQSNNRYEVPQADCETAALALGLSDTSATIGNYGSGYPSGCFYLQSRSLYFNLSPVGVSCGTSGDDCICGAVGTANCDASELLPNAETVGNCSSSLPSGSSCANVAFSGAANCT